MPFWPLAIPQKPLRSGYTDTAPNNLLRSDMETGPAKVRRRGTAKPHKAQVTYIMSNEEAAIFEEFAIVTLAGGSIAFDWWHPVLRRYVRARLLPENEGLFARTYFSESLQWQYALSIEYWPDISVAGPEIPEEPEA